MMKILNPYLKRVMRGRPRVSRFLEQKSDSLEIPYFPMKAGILSLLFFPFPWLGAGIQAGSHAAF